MAPAAVDHLIVAVRRLASSASRKQYAVHMECRGAGGVSVVPVMAAAQRVPIAGFARAGNNVHGCRFPGPAAGLCGVWASSERICFGWPSPPNLVGSDVLECSWPEGLAFYWLLC